jgi:hypothetical protein
MRPGSDGLVPTRAGPSSRRRRIRGPGAELSAGVPHHEPRCVPRDICVRCVPRRSGGRPPNSRPRSVKLADFDASICEMAQQRLAQTIDDEVRSGLFALLGPVVDHRTIRLVSCHFVSPLRASVQSPHSMSTPRQTA